MDAATYNCRVRWGVHMWETSFEISEFGNMLKSLVVSSVVNIVIHFTDGLRNSRNRDLLTVCSEQVEVGWNACINLQDE